ncbi:gibberellin 3beta-dioxygenase [Ranunculus cassubicifolius]
MPSRLSDAFRAHPVHLHDNHLDLGSVREVPESHAWPPILDYPAKDSYQIESVPIIDLKGAKSAKLIGNACENWGVFQVTNHGIPLRLLEDVESQGRRLFSLPSHQKLKAARTPDGISGYGRARISSFFPKLMWSEGFTMVGSPIEHARQLWPQDYKKFCDVMEEYEKEMKNLATRIMWVMLGSLGITKEDLKWASPKGELQGACAALQMNSYPPCPDPNRAMGLAAHTDSTLLTLLYQNNTSGLQVLRDGVGWVTVPPVTGALVVNVGDLIHILSNGRYPSILHRAVVHRTRHRLSIAYLYGPPPTTQISPLPKLIDLKNPPLYRSVTWSEYLGTKAKHFNKALSSVRIYRPPQKGSNDIINFSSMKVK